METKRDNKFDLPSNANKMIEESKNVAKKSWRDWISYLCDHPAQSLLFGVTIFLALKGLKD